MPPVAGIGDSPLVPPPSDTRQHGGQAASVATPSERFEQSFSTVLAQVMSQTPGTSAHAGHDGAGGGLAGTSTAQGASHSGDHNITAPGPSGRSHPGHFPIGESNHAGGHDFQATALGLRAYRQQLIASNIANADTPGYKAVDIDFQEALRIARSVAKPSPLTLSATASGHISGQAQPLRSSLSPQISHSVASKLRREYGRDGCRTIQVCGECSHVRVFAGSGQRPFQAHDGDAAESEGLRCLSYCRDSPRQLRWLLCQKTQRLQRSLSDSRPVALRTCSKLAAPSWLRCKRVADSARHFESPAMQLAINAKAPEEHAALSRLLDRTRFVGIRVFSADRTLIYETWEDVPVALIDAARSRQHDWPERGQSHQNWVEVGGRATDSSRFAVSRRG
jgi:flagellar basal-body rod protein FlgB